MNRLLKKRRLPCLPVQRSKGLERSSDFLKEERFIPSEFLCSPPLNASLFPWSFPRSALLKCLCKAFYYFLGRKYGPSTVKWNMWVWSPKWRQNLLVCLLAAWPHHRVLSGSMGVHCEVPRGPRWTTSHKPKGEAAGATAFSKTSLSMLIPHSSISRRALPSQVTPRLWSPRITGSCLPPESENAFWPRTSAIPSHPWNTGTFPSCQSPVCLDEPQSLFLLLALVCRTKGALPSSSPSTHILFSPPPPASARKSSFYTLMCLIKTLLFPNLSPGSFGGQMPGGLTGRLCLCPVQFLPGHCEHRLVICWTTRGMGKARRS